MGEPGPRLDQITRIVDQLQRAFDGDAWHGPAVLELLSDVDAKTASAKPIAGAHSIWEIVNHIATWDHTLRRRMNGEVLQPKGSEDWPPVREHSERAWRDAVDMLKIQHAELLKAVTEMPEHRLLSIVPGKEHDFYHELHGTVQHELYHAGQIALLKKART